MSRQLLAFLLLMLALPLQAQISGVVRDSISQQPIPYVSIWVENENLGTTSEENGRFQIAANQDKKLVFSALGYGRKIVLAYQANQVFLAPKTIGLEQVTVVRKQSTETATIGDFKQKRLNAGVANVGQENVHVWAKWVQSNPTVETHPFLQSVAFVTESQRDKVLLRLRLIAIDAEGFPQGDVVDEDILVPIAKGKHTNTVDLAKYNIRIPASGILVGFEYLKLGQNARYDGDRIVKYEPSILGFYPGAETLVMLNRDGTLHSGIPGNYGNVELALKIKLSN